MGGDKRVNISDISWHFLAWKKKLSKTKNLRTNGLKTKGGDPWKKNIIFQKKSSKCNETWIKKLDFFTDKNKVYICMGHQLKIIN